MEQAILSVQQRNIERPVWYMMYSHYLKWLLNGGINQPSNGKLRHRPGGARAQVPCCFQRSLALEFVLSIFNLEYVPLRITMDVFFLAKRNQMGCVNGGYPKNTPFDGENDHKPWDGVPALPLTQIKSWWSPKDGINASYSHSSLFVYPWKKHSHVSWFMLCLTIGL